MLLVGVQWKKECVASLLSAPATHEGGYGAVLQLHNCGKLHSREGQGREWVGGSAAGHHDHGGVAPCEQGAADRG